jgi:predicted DNA-binding WGR domain protein
MRHFELVDGTSNKFWEIDYVDGASDYTVTWGRIGTAGQTQTKEFATAEKAKSEQAKLVAEKVKKGYSEVGASVVVTAAPTLRAAPAPKAPAAPAPATPAAAAIPTEAPTTPTPEAEPNVTTAPGGRTGGRTGGRPMPDIAAEDGLLWSNALAPRTWAVRGHERATHMPATRTLDAAVKGVLREANSYNNFAKTIEAATGPNSDNQKLIAALQQLLDFAEVLALVKGVPTTLDMIAHIEGGAAWSTWNHSLERLARFRALIATAPEADYQAWAEHARALALTKPNAKFLAFLFPTEDFSTTIADTNSDVMIASSASSVYTGPQSYNFFGSTTSDYTPAHSILHRAGLEALPMVLATSPYGAEGTATRAEILAHCGSDIAFAELVKQIEDRHTQRALTTACSLQPHRAIRFLAGLRGKAEDTARLRLTGINHEFPGLLEAYLETATPDAAKMLRSILDAASIEAVAFSTVPQFLQTPAWTKKRVGVDKPTVLARADVHVTTPPAEIVWRPGEEKEITRATYWSPFSYIRTESDSPAAKVACGKLNPAEFSHVPDKLRAESLGVEAAMDCYDAAGNIALILAKIGAPAIPYLIKCANVAPTTAANGLQSLASADIAGAMALAMSTKSGRRVGASWFARHVEHGIAGLIPEALAKPGKGRTAAERALRQLANSGHRDRIIAVAASGGAEVSAGIARALEADPLDLLPAKMPALPGWCLPAGLAPLVVLDRSGKLPDDAVNHVISMMQISTLDEPYVGLEMLREHVTPESLESFSWSVFQTWASSGYPKDGAWAISQLGILGGDMTARKLSPLIRVWPGEAAHARATTGLDVLAAIGSDVSLMHLNRISETGKFKGLKENAQARIASIAEARGLTREQLADLLVPDLGLDDDGSLWLDFGPRRFRVGFDELLSAIVKDESGAILRALPKPNAKDDADKAKAAGERWKALKKDATEASKIQMRRIELAMSLRRRWDTDSFATVFVNHPLMFHVVRRLVWAVFDPAGSVVTSFRVAEDRTFADANDDTVALPEMTDANGLKIGIVHPLQLNDATLGAWGTVFADYEILQPFPQLGRECFALTDAEKSSTKLERFTDIRCHFGKILSLEYKGWEKGAPQDAGVIGEMVKPLSDGRWVSLGLSEGLWAGYMTETPEQNLGALTIINERDTWKPTTSKLDTVDPIEMSEVLRDLEMMR